MLEAVKALRYATISQLSEYLGEPKQNVAKRLQRSNIRHFRFQGKNVYTLDSKNPRFIEHELLVTDTLIRLRPVAMQRTGISTPDINPDAWYQTEQGEFWLEVENGAGHASLAQLIEKAWGYLEVKGRVHFDLPTALQAERLCEAIRQSGIRHLGKFWISWRGDLAKSPNGKTYQLRPSPGLDNYRS